MWSAVVVVMAWLAGVAFAQPLFSPTQDPVPAPGSSGPRAASSATEPTAMGGKVGPDPGRIARSRAFFDLAALVWNHLPGMVARRWELGIPSPQLAASATGDPIACL